MNYYKGTVAGLILVHLVTGCSSNSENPPHTPDFSQSPCEGVPYTVGYTGTKGVLTAELAADVIKEIREFTQKQNLDLGSINVEAQAKTEKKLAATFSETAYLLVADAYFCKLIFAYPDKKESLLRAQFDFNKLISKLFSRDLYEGSYFEAQQKLLHIESEAQARPEVLSVDTNILPKENFTQRHLIEAKIKGSVSSLANISTCLGTAFTNLSPMPEQTYTGLQGLRTQIHGYLRGGVRSQISVQLMMSTPKHIINEPFTPSLSLDDLVCINTVTYEKGTEI